jgi:hypothetical protein
MSSVPLDALPLWGLVLAVSLLLVLALECGYRVGRWRHTNTPDERDQPVGAMVASILGLLALVLGFTFSLAASRFEARRQVVLEEANAIGTAYLRARLLPEPQRTKTENLLREYVDVRIRGVAEGKIEEILTRSETLHESLWTQATAAAEKNPNSIMTGVFIQALNNVIDLHAKRVMVGLRSRIPLVIWAGLFGLTMLGMVSVGYQAGLSTTRRSPAMLGLVLSFSVVLLLVADLDRGQEGLLRVSQQALMDVQTAMRPQPPQQK